MKIRNGFVTNSSSSSFIVSFERLPESESDLQKMLFGDKEYVAKYDEALSASYVAGRVWKDMTRSRLIEDQTWVNWNVIDFWDIASCFDSGQLEGAPDIYLYSDDGWFRSSNGYNPRYIKEMKTHTRSDGSTYECPELDWNLYHRDLREFAFEKAKEFYDKFEDDYVFKFEYSDNSGDSILEHGGIFDGLGSDRVIRISHH